MRPSSNSNKFRWRAHTIPRSLNDKLITIRVLKLLKCFDPFFDYAQSKHFHMRMTKKMLTENELIRRSLPNFVSSHRSWTFSHRDDLLHAFYHVCTVVARHGDIETVSEWKAKAKRKYTFCFEDRVAAIKKNSDFFHFFFFPQLINSTRSFTSKCHLTLDKIAIRTNAKQLPWFGIVVRSIILSCFIPPLSNSNRTTKEAKQNLISCILFSFSFLALACARSLIEWSIVYDVALSST